MPAVAGQSIEELARRLGGEVYAAFRKDPTPENLMNLTVTLFHVAAGLWAIAARKLPTLPPEGAFGAVADETAKQVWSGLLRPPMN